MVSEDQLIERVRQKLPTRASGLPIGIGDDAAIIRHRGRGDWAVTTDAFLENVHFLQRVHPPHAVGYKALVRATSDLAAMGARPRYFLLGLALPGARTGKWLDDFLDGMALAARRLGLVLAGGDTTKCPTIAINLTVLGEIEPGRAILRSGARPGDLICVSGKLGEAELGLQLVRRRLHKQAHWKKLLKKQFYPQPRVALGQWLATHGRATSMIDTSDGLSTDLAHICKASGVGAQIWAEEIPTAVVPRELGKLGFDPLSMALNGGDDYELLFTVSKVLAARLPRTVGRVPITIIGQVIRDKRIVLVSRMGQAKPLPAQGWDPFQKLPIRNRAINKLK